MSIEEKIEEFKKMRTIDGDDADCVLESGSLLSYWIEELTLDIQKETARQMADIDPKSHLTDTLLKNRYKLITGEEYE